MMLEEETEEGLIAVVSCVADLLLLFACLWRCMAVVDGRE